MLVHCRYIVCSLVSYKFANISVSLIFTSNSAGVGRTGTFICIDSVLEKIKKERVVDIAGVINKMRYQRMKMVQTPVSNCWI